MTIGNIELTPSTKVNVLLDAYPEVGQPELKPDAVVSLENIL